MRPRRGGTHRQERRYLTARSIDSRFVDCKGAPARKAVPEPHADGNGCRLVGRCSRRHPW